MTPITTLFLFLILMAMGVPVAYVMYLVAGVFFLTSGVNISALVQKVGNSINSITLLSIPTFMFAGSIMNNAGLTDALFGSINITPIGKLRGGLAHVNIVSSLIFAGMSGAALADIGGLGKIEIRAMTQNGYSLDDATGITLASSAIGPIFPPSIPMMLYALYAEQSGVRMLMAGIVPAVLMSLLMMAVVVYRARKYGWPTEQSKLKFMQRLKIFAWGLPALSCPLFLLGGMYAGKFAPSELAAVCCVLAIVLGLVVYRKLTPKIMWSTAKESVGNISTMLFITGAATLFAYTITRLQIPQALQAAILQFSTNKWALLMLVNVVLLIIGMFMDCNIAIMILVPLLLPTFVSVGVDPIHLGVIVVLNVVIGIFTPPFGTALFLGAIITELPFTRLVKAMMPYYLPLVATLILVTFIPAMSTWLPTLIYG